MRYSYLSGYPEFRLAQKIYIRSSVQRRLRFHFYMWGLFLIGVLVIVVLLVSGNGPQTWLGKALFPLAVGALTGGIVTPLLRPWTLRRCYKASVGESGEPRQIYLELDGSTLISGIEASSEGRFQRSAVCETYENEQMLLLFITKKKFLYIPKQKVPIQAIEETRAWLALPGAKPC